MIIIFAKHGVLRVIFFQDWPEINNKFTAKLSNIFKITKGNNHRGQGRYTFGYKYRSGQSGHLALVATFLTAW